MKMHTKFLALIAITFVIGGFICYHNRAQIFHTTSKVADKADLADEAENLSEIADVLQMKLDTERKFGKPCVMLELRRDQYEAFFEEYCGIANSNNHMSMITASDNKFRTFVPEYRASMLIKKYAARIVDQK